MNMNIIARINYDGLTSFIFNFGLDIFRTNRSASYSYAAMDPFSYETTKGPNLLDNKSTYLRANQYTHHSLLNYTINIPR